MPRKRMGEERYGLSLLLSALDGGELSGSRLGRLYPRGQRPLVPTGRVGLRAA
jgi:hypothetical protein